MIRAILSALVALVAVFPTDVQSESIGYDFTGVSPDDPVGDTAGFGLFYIHNYPMPVEGFVTGGRFRNDVDRVQEYFDLYILRPTEVDLGVIQIPGWTVVHIVRVDEDDAPPVTTGDAAFSLPSPLPVEAGDVFAHYYAGTLGPIPFNRVWPNTPPSQHFVGRSQIHSAFATSTQVGAFIPYREFDGPRDYFLNLDFQPVPEPACRGLIACGLTALRSCVSRRRRFRAPRPA